MAIRRDFFHLALFVSLALHGAALFYSASKPSAPSSPRPFPRISANLLPMNPVPTSTPSSAPKLDPWKIESKSADEAATPSPRSEPSEAHPLPIPPRPETKKKSAEASVASSKAPSPTKAPSAAPETVVAGALRRLSTQLLYPKQEIAAGHEGTVILGIAFDAAGRVSGARVESSSGYPALDQAALAAARRMPPMPQAADEIIQLPVDFALR